MLTLETLRLDQYRQVAEWEFGPQGENADWERYEREMSQPQWWHYGIYDDSSFVGAVSLENISYNMVAYHVVTARRKVNPHALADALLKLAGLLFKADYTAVTANIPIEKRAAARLAIRCGMKEWGRTPTTRYFILTKEKFQRV
jgi:hypothetical protein